MQESLHAGTIMQQGPAWLQNCMLSTIIKQSGLQCPSQSTSLITCRNGSKFIMEDPRLR